LDPQIEVKPAKNQVDSLIKDLRDQVARKERTLVTTLTKKSAENLSEYLQSLQFRVRYLHSDIETLERSQLIKDLRLGVFDILIGINLLREGLDIPEVSLVAILDADKEGFLRSTRALLQTCGRAARNVRGRVIMFGDEITKSMAGAIEETERRRTIQTAYNKEHGITPVSIIRAVGKSLVEVAKEAGHLQSALLEESEVTESGPKELDAIGSDIAELEAQKKEAVKNLDFERAAKIRDKILLLKRVTVLEGSG